MFIEARLSNKTILIRRFLFLQQRSKWQTVCDLKTRYLLWPIPISMPMVCFADALTFELSSIVLFCQVELTAIVMRRWCYVEVLVVEELYKEAVVNTDRKLIIFNGELDRIRSGCILLYKFRGHVSENISYVICTSTLFCIYFITRKCSQFIIFTILRDSGGHFWGLHSCPVHLCWTLQI